MAPAPAIIFAPFPDAAVRPHLGQEHWNELVTIWATATRAQAQRFQAQGKDAGSHESLATFLASWVEANARGVAADQLGPAANLRLAKNCYFLTSQLITATTPPDQLLSWQFMADFSAVFSGSQYASNNRVAALAERVFGGPDVYPQATKSLANLKKSLVQSLHAAPKFDLDGLAATLVRVQPLVSVSPAVASQLSSGSDFVDGLVSAYRTMHPPLREAIICIAYLCLVGLCRGRSPNLAMLSDQLFELKAAADAHRAGPLRAEDSLVPELVSVTPILDKLRQSIANASSPAAKTLATRLDLLAEYRRPGAEEEARRRAGRLRGPSKAAKGKGKAVDVDLGHSIGDSRLMVISQVQEVFPHLGQGFVSRLLDEFGENANAVISNMYDETLPPHLAEADPSETLETYTTPTYLEPQLPSRKNAFDGDELDTLAVKASKLSFGKTLNERTADDILNDRSSAPSKSQIKSALQSFDPDEDERDDTYDADDVGGAVNVVNDGEDEEEDPSDETLFQAYRKTPELFDRTPEVRKSAERARLRDATGQTDDAIEGWAFMLGQNLRRQRQLEQRYGVERIAQNEIQRTSYRAVRGEDGEEAEGSGRPFGRGGGYRGYRGRGRGRGGGGGGSVAGPSGEKDMEQARRRKEASKGSRANHNRREGHAKKMARGGFGF